MLYSARRSGAQYNWGYLAMILIPILDHNTYLCEDISSNLQPTDLAAMTALDGENLSAWLAPHGVDMLALPLPIENKRALTTAISTKPEKPNSNKQTRWQLNSSQLELITLGGSSILLSHNEYSVLRAAANANEIRSAAKPSSKPWARISGTTTNADSKR